MKKIILIFLLQATIGFAQNINDYQYVIVPKKFSIFNEEDRFRLNTLTKLVLEKYGFKTFFITDIPEEISKNRCQILFADLDEKKGLLVTKLKIILKDCYEKTVYETEYGTSREKDFQVAYTQALREAAKGFDKLNYKFSGKSSSNNEQVVAEEEKQPVEEPNALSSENPEIFYFAQPIANGFQIVNNEPRVIMRLLNTSQKNVFIGMRGDTRGVVIMKDGKWLFEYYEEGKLISEPIKLKF